MELPEKVKAAIEKAIAIEENHRDYLREMFTTGAEIALQALSLPPDGSLVEEMQTHFRHGRTWGEIIDDCAAVAERRMQALQAEVERLRAPLQAITMVKRLEGEPEKNYQYNRCWHIAYDALNPKS